MDQRRVRPGRPAERRRLLDLDDAPPLDPSEETALEAIRQQLDEEFASAEATPGAPDPPRDRGPHVGDPVAERLRPRALRLDPEPFSPTDPEPRPRPASDGRKPTRAGSERDVRARFAPEAEERPARGLRERQPPAWARPERPRDEPRGQERSRIGRGGPTDRFPVQRIPARWRETTPPVPDERKSPRGLFVTMGLAAGLTGGAAGALLTVLLLTGDASDGLRQSWGKVVAAARDGGLVDMAATVKDRTLSAQARGPASRGAASDSRVSERRDPPASPARPEPATASGGVDGGRGPRAQESAASLELRSLVTAGRDAYVQRDYAMAERLFSQAVERSMSDGLLRYHRAIALMGLGRFSEARIEFQNALRLGVDPVVADEAQRALSQLDAGRRRR